MTAAPGTLERFVEAQAGSYDTALAELRAGHKQSHWMWWIFPQLAALGRSHRAKIYGIADADEARAYARHPVLGPRLQACAEAVLMHPERSAEAIMGPVDAMKLRSCATLFVETAPAPLSAVMAALLAQFYGGQPDAETLRLLAG